MKILTQTIDFKLKHLLFSKGNIVFIHGFSSSYYKSINFLILLYKKGYNIYSFDLPNHGENKEFDHQYSMEEYLEYVEEKIKSLNLKSFFLIGHSMGGAISSVIVNKFDNIKKLVLIDPFNFGHCSLHIHIHRLGLKLIKPIGPLFTPFLAKNPTNLSFDPRKLLISLFSQSFLEILDKNVSEISKPILIIFGEQDETINPERSKTYFDEKFKDKRDYYFKLLPELKHSPQNEDKERIKNVVLEFLKHGK
ncbi:MAG: alpha/beta hydrolase [Mycoplasmataceae bacterium]|jgi:pimeloyl-ACP methyl ester carboxylesterase|nr:alpha/beta hydrolase [Mycoplasmataceae bacterium]